MQRALAESHFSALYYYIIFYKKVNIKINLNKILYTIVWQYLDFLKVIVENKIS